MSRLRDEPSGEEGSSADEGVPPSSLPPPLPLPKVLDGWDVVIPCQLVWGIYSREVCDGQTLASPGRWPISARRYPDSSLWCSLSASFMEFSRRFGTPDLLMRLALGRVDSCPFDPASIRSFKSSTLDILIRGWSEVGDA